METQDEHNGGTYLTGKLLIAMPQMADTRFEKAVILLCAHDENGAMGLVINNTVSDIKFDALLDQLGITSDIEVNLRGADIQVMSGGPVDGSRGFLLHGQDFAQEGTISIDSAYHVTGTIDALEAVARGQGPNDMLFILGYAGWSNGQLEQELKQNSWLVVDPDPDLIFAVKAEQKWQSAVQKLGFDLVMLTGEAGRA